MNSDHAVYFAVLVITKHALILENSAQDILKYLIILPEHRIWRFMSNPIFWGK